MITQVTVCGLHIVSGVEFRASQTGLYQVEVVDEGEVTTAGVAVQFAQQLVRDEAAANAYPPTTFFAAAVHPGWVERYEGLDFADLEVDADEELSIYPTESLFTVCGVVYETGETYCDNWLAHGPKMAYYEAWKAGQQIGRELLLSNVHAGVVPTSYDFQFADPVCSSEPMMLDLMREYGLEV